MKKSNLIKFAEALAKHIAAGSPEVKLNTYYQRLSICLKCEYFDKKKIICNKCGCYMDVKAKWADQECPLDPPKWKKIELPVINNNWTKPQTDCGCK